MWDSLSHDFLTSLCERHIFFQEFLRSLCRRPTMRITRFVINFQLGVKKTFSGGEEGEE
jgi:hypothetical protein